MSNKIQKDTAEFMIAAGQEVQNYPSIPNDETRILHANLILEEFLETVHGMGLVVAVNPENGKLSIEDGEQDINMVESYDGLLDLSYVINGAANAWGFDMEKGLKGQVIAPPILSRLCLRQ
jgi:hypothetical protein